MDNIEKCLLAKTLEKTDINAAISLYEQLISDNYDGSAPYERLIIIYNKLHMDEDAIRVAEHAVYIFSNIVNPARVDRETKLLKFKERLDKLNCIFSSKNHITKPVTPQNIIDTITVIDFETASSAYYSACAIGIVILRNREIVDKKYYLIQPPENFYEKQNIEIHGITSQDTADAPTFPVIWEQIKDMFNNSYIAAHNANFDMSVLKSVLNYYGIEQPKFQYMNTISVSSYCIPYGENVAKTLEARCNYFGIPISEQHNALCDAEAAANLIIYQLEHSRYKTFASFVKCSVNLFDYEDVKLKRETHWMRRVKIKDIAEVTTVAEVKDEDFNGKNFVITGDLIHFTRSEAIAKIIERGGKVKSSVSKKVDVLINANPEGTKTGKVSEALELQAQGYKIKIISEDTFMKMLENNAAID